MAPDIEVLEADVVCSSSKIQPPHRKCRALSPSREKRWEEGVVEKGGICGVVWHFVAFSVVIVKLGGVGVGRGGKGFWVLGSGGSPQRARTSQRVRMIATNISIRLSQLASIFRARFP